MPSLTEARAGAAAIAPMLLGIVPFGLVAGAAPVSQGFDAWSAVGLSTIVFAGTSQLAIVDVLGREGSALVAILAALTINLRMVLYSASLAPYLSHVPTGRRLAASYLLNDQMYALSVGRWARDDGADGRLSFYIGGGVLIWAAWVGATVVGVVVGAAVPEEVPLDFAVPLAFLVLLMPVLADRPAVVAAVAGGVAAVMAAEAGAGPLATIVGVGAGIVAGAVVDAQRPAPASP